MVSFSLLTSILLFALCFFMLLLFSGFHPCPLCLHCPRVCSRCGCCTALRRKQNRCSKPLGQVVRPAPPTYGSRWVRLFLNWASPDYPIAYLRSGRRAGGTSPADVSPVACPSLLMELLPCARTTEQLEGHTLLPTARRMGTGRRGFAVEWSKKLLYMSIQNETCSLCQEHRKIQYWTSHTKQHKTFNFHLHLWWRYKTNM